MTHILSVGYSNYLQHQMKDIRSKNVFKDFNAMYCIPNITSFPDKRSYFNIVLLCTKQLWPNSSFQKNIGKVIISFIIYISSKFFVTIFSIYKWCYVFLKGCNITFQSSVKNIIVEEIIYHKWYCRRHVSRALKAFRSQFYFSIRIVSTFTSEYKCPRFQKKTVKPFSVKLKLVWKTLCFVKII